MADHQNPSGATAAVPALPWTGERYVPELGGQIALEHLHRYAFACGLSAGKDVLDIACGEGYGSALLAANARSVVGVDIAADVVQHAEARYGRSNLSFRKGACHQIPLAARSVDLVVSFETIEHVDRHELMLAEIKRVLRSGGTLLISSPEKSQYSDAVNQSNPFHVKELYNDEFRALLAAHFRHVAVGGQRVVFGSAILMDDPGGPVRSYHWNGVTHAGGPGMSQPRYLIALASDQPLPAAGGGVFEQPINDSEIIQGWARAVHERDQQIASLTARNAELTARLEERDAPGDGPATT